MTKHTPSSHIASAVGSCPSTNKSVGRPALKVYPVQSHHQTSPREVKIREYTVKYAHSSVFYVPATKWGGAYSFTLVRTYVHPSNILVLFLSPQLILKYLMQGLETWKTVQICIGHMHKGIKILIQVIIAELHPLEWLTYFGPYHTVVLFLSPQHLLKYLMQGLETWNTVRIGIGHMHKGNRILIRITSPWMTYIFWTISHCSTILIFATPPKVFDAGTWKLKHSSDMHWTCA